MDGFWTLTEAPSQDESYHLAVLQQSPVLQDTAQFEFRKNGEIYVYHLDTDEVTVEKDILELTAQEVTKHWDKVQIAVRKEIRSFFDLDTFFPVPKSTVPNEMSSKWVFRWKVVGGEKVVKARLTIRGFEDREAESLATYAGTTSRWGQRLISSLAAQHQWVLLSADVSTAFLQGLSFAELSKLTGEPERVVSFKPPKNYESFFRELPGLSALNFDTHTLRMKKCVYGLKDAPRAWRKRLDQVLVGHGLKALAVDAAVYSSHDKSGNLNLCLSCHVDDLKICGEKATVAALLACLGVSSAS